MMAQRLTRQGLVLPCAALMKLSRIVAFLVLAAGFPRLMHAEMADGIRAIVNDTVITYAQVLDFTGPAIDALRRQYSSQPDVFDQKAKATFDDGLEQLVERQLILHEYEVKYSKLPDSVIDGLVEDRIRDRFGDRVTLMKTLQAEGMTFEQFRSDLRDQYVESILRNQNIQREVTISPYKVESYYLAHQDDFKLEDQAKLRMIVLTKSSPDDTNTLALAHEILGRIRNGATFQEMAAVYSQGAQQHQNGDWGWVERSVLRKELADMAFSLKPGQVSDVVDTPDSDYIVLVEDRKTAHVRPLADVRDEIEKILRTQEQARLQKNWIDGLKKKSFIRFFS